MDKILKFFVAGFLLIALIGIGIWMSISSMRDKPYNDCISISKFGFDWFAKGEDPKFISSEDMKFGYYCAKFPKIGGATCIEDYCRQKYGIK